MLYTIFATDSPNSLEKRMSVRPQHIQRLEKLNSQNRLIIAGPHPKENSEGFTGSLIIADFDNIIAAKEWANADPYFKSGAFISVTVKPFKKVLP